MRTEMKRNPDNPDSFDLYVNGVRKIVAESYVMVCNIEAALFGSTLVVAEATEIAESILRGEKEIK